MRNISRDSKGRFTSTHGEGKGTKLYHAWDSMKQRCYNKNHKAYQRYGGRGILIEDVSWFDFIAFRDWAVANGYKEGLSIDRIDNSKGYNPQNCRWVSRGENSRKDKVKPVNQISLNGDIIATYPSITVAKKLIGGHICEVLRGKYGHKTAGGCYWDYADLTPDLAYGKIIGERSNTRIKEKGA